MMALIMQCLFILVRKGVSFMRKKKKKQIFLYFSLSDKKQDDSNGN